MLAGRLRRWRGLDPEQAVGFGDITSPPELPHDSGDEEYSKHMHLSLCGEEEGQVSTYLYSHLQLLTLLISVV